MPARPTTQRTLLRQIDLAEAREVLAPTVAIDPLGCSAGRTLALLALLAAIVALIAAPALVASLSLLDGHFLDRNLSWSPLPPYLYLGPVAMTAGLAGVVARAKEDQ